MDFAGGFPATGNGVNFGIVRLQTASLHFDWEHTSSSQARTPYSSRRCRRLRSRRWRLQLRLRGKSVGLDAATAGGAPLHLSDQQTITLQAGVLDNLDWEYPSDPFYRGLKPESSRASPPMPRVRHGRGECSSTLSVSASPATTAARIGHGAAYVDAWAGMADWQIPIAAAIDAIGRVLSRPRHRRSRAAPLGRSIVWGGNPICLSSHSRPRRRRWMDPTQVPADTEAGVQWGRCG